MLLLCVCVYESFERVLTVDIYRVLRVWCRNQLSGPFVDVSAFANTTNMTFAASTIAPDLYVFQYTLASVADPGVSTSTMLTLTIQSANRVCVDDTVLVDGVCVPCVNGSVSVNGVCACVNGTVLIDGHCVCANGTVLVDGTCQCVNGTANVDGTCQCVNGTVLVDGMSVCQRHSAVDGTCRIINGTVDVDGMCQCVNGTTLVDGFCTCVNGTSLINGGCGCYYGTTLVDGACRCVNGTMFDGYCVPGSVECMDGFVLLNGRCLPGGGGFECGRAVVASPPDLVLVLDEGTFSLQTPADRHVYVCVCRSVATVPQLQ